MVHSNNYGPSIWMAIITYYLLRGNRINVFLNFEKRESKQNFRKNIYQLDLTCMQPHEAKVEVHFSFLFNLER
jgi:hypothetical protein